LNNNNNGNHIETPRLTQRQRDIIRSKDIKPAITTAAESTTENAAIDRKSDTTTEEKLMNHSKI